MLNRRDLKILWSSNAVWSNSGYARFTDDWSQRVLKDGWPIRLIAWAGLAGGTIEHKGIYTYPQTNDIWGGDAMVEHGQHFQTNVNFSMQDVHAINPQFLQQLPHWIPYCLDGETLVEFTDGRQLPIKEVVKNKIKGQVWGYKNGKIVKSKILAWQKIPELMDVYELKTKSSKILITGNNEVFVNGKWIKADCIQKGDVVYLYTNGSLYNVQAKYDSRGNGLSSRNNRRRRNNYNYAGQKNSQGAYISFSTSFHNNFFYKRGINKMDRRKDGYSYKQSSKKYWQQIQSFLRKNVSIIKNVLSNSNMGFQLPVNSEFGFALPYNQKASGRNSFEISKFSGGTIQGQEQSTLYQRGNRFMGTSQNFEPEVVMAIRKVKAAKRRVFDISTETGNFFANKILVHNCPIDREEVPPAVLNALRYAYKIITFSKFGQKALERNGFASTMIPEGTDTSIFRPMDKMAVRDELKFPKDKFIFGMIAANKPDGISRKGWQQALDAFAIFVKTHPDSLFFYEFNQGGGFDIPQYAQFLGIGDKLLTTNMYMNVIHGDPNVVAKWLNACDVVLNCSTTEGFGLVVVEAQACGTPVLITDCMSMPELITEKTGEKVKTILKLWTSGGGYINFPDPIDMAEKMEILWKRVKTNEEGISKDCREWIKENYSIDKIYKDRWLPYLESLQTELLGEPKIDIVEKKV